MSEMILGDTLPTIMEPDKKPVATTSGVQFPPFPAPTDADFDSDLTQEERDHYKSKFPDLNVLKTMRLHCTACDRHLGISARNETRMRSHPMLRTLVCHTCHTFYNSGEFDKGDDGSELYCRWCGQGGQVYCCSDCPHVFCAKCIKRNFGMDKIKEIENTDDWKCFKCNPKCLLDLRATCWALLRFCDLRNKLVYQTEDITLKEAYQKEIALDLTECCKNKTRRKEKEVKKKEPEEKKERETKRNSLPALNVMTKLPPQIQVKKFASINLDESPKEKKAQKRPASPQNRGHSMMVLPAPPAPSATKMFPKILPMPTGPPGPKKVKLPIQTQPVMYNPVRMQKDRITPYSRVRPKILTPISHPPPHLLMNNQMNGFNANRMFNNNMMFGDNINLSLDNLTQGLDMATVAAMSQGAPQDDVVCTPDFPLEPLCEVMEDNTDDEVECITPANAVTRRNDSPQPKVSRAANLPDINTDNIIQMTENDVTVNALTGGLKFRVDPQTLSSNKMYRLPDGRIFAINPNPNMPGGYSATIVAVTDAGTGKTASKSATYAAKLSAVSSSQQKPNDTSTPRNNRNRNVYSSPKNKTVQKKSKTKDNSDNSIRKCDLSVPVEWYRFSLIDATDCLEYSLLRLQKLKKDATTAHLRTRTIDEMRFLHKSLESVLNTSIVRFSEIQENLKKEFKNYIAKKTNKQNVADEDDDDDVEILNEQDDDPIFIDENSMDSNNGVMETQEVDLTEVGSEQNDSGEKSVHENDMTEKTNVSESMQLECDESVNGINDASAKENVTNNENKSDEHIAIQDNIPNSEDSRDACEKSEISKINGKSDDKNNESVNDTKDTTNVSEPCESSHGDEESVNEKADSKDISKNDEDADDSKKSLNNEKEDANDGKDLKKPDDSEVSDPITEQMDINEEKSQDAEMSDEMIESLLKGDSAAMDDIDSQNLNLDFQDSLGAV